MPNLFSLSFFSFILFAPSFISFTHVLSPLLVLYALHHIFFQSFSIFSSMLTVRLNRSPTRWVRWPSTDMSSLLWTTARLINPCGSTWAMRDPHRAWRAWRTWVRVIGALYRQWRCLPCPLPPAWVPLCQGLALLHHPLDLQLKVPAAVLFPPPSAPAHSNLDASELSLVVWSGARASDIPWLWNEGAGELVIQWGLVFRTWKREKRQNFLILPGGV